VYRKGLHSFETQSGNSYGTQESIFKFAEQAARCLKERVPGSIIRGMLRVDIMCREDGVLVVNEFESLEAFYTHKDHASRGAETEQFMIEFWIAELTKLL